MTRTYTETVTLQEIECCACGVTFAFPQRLHKECMSTGKAFYCPNGHSQVYREREEVRLSKQLQIEQSRYKQLEMQFTSVQDQLQATKRELQRHEKRVANGVCPCCNRSFVQLQRHMKAKHPEHASQ